MSEHHFTMQSTEPAFVRVMVSSDVEQTVSIHKRNNTAAGTAVFKGKGNDNAPLPPAGTTPSWLETDSLGRLFFTPTANEEYTLSVQKTGSSSAETLHLGHGSTAVSFPKTGTFHIYWAVNEASQSGTGDFTDSVVIVTQGPWGNPLPPPPPAPTC